jgi:hypothetical protein
VKIRSSITAAAAVVLSGTGALVLPAVASAHSAPHTLKFTAVTNKSHTFTRTSGGSQETDVSAGKTIGFDVVYFKGTGKNAATVNAAFDLKGGLLYATAVTTNGKTFSGKVTGGTGAFKGATGTITAKSSANNKTAITIIYS